MTANELGHRRMWLASNCVHAPAGRNLDRSNECSRPGLETLSGRIRRICIGGNEASTTVNCPDCRGQTVPTQVLMTTDDDDVHRLIGVNNDGLSLLKCLKDTRTSKGKHTIPRRDEVRHRHGRGDDVAFRVDAYPLKARLDRCLGVLGMVRDEGQRQTVGSKAPNGLHRPSDGFTAEPDDTVEVDGESHATSVARPWRPSGPVRHWGGPKT